MRALWPLLLLLALHAPAGAEAPAIGLIIDDMGYDLAAGRSALALPGAVTYAFIPATANAVSLAREAYDRGKEIIVHLPMQADGGRPLEAGGLTRDMTPAELRGAVAAGLAAVPHARGANNHMGSLLTRDARAMEAVMGALSAGPYYFVDSRTTDASVAEQTARRHGVAATRRDVFLDNVQDESYVAAQFDLLVEMALERGHAVGIAHPYPETLAVLQRRLPGLAERGVGVLPVSRIIERQRREPLWHASSSPLPKVAKNSKP